MLCRGQFIILLNNYLVPILTNTHELAIILHFSSHHVSHTILHFVLYVSIGACRLLSSTQEEWTAISTPYLCPTTYWSGQYFVSVQWPGFSGYDSSYLWCNGMYCHSHFHYHCHCNLLSLVSFGIRLKNEPREVVSLDQINSVLAPIAVWQTDYPANVVTITTARNNLCSYYTSSAVR